MKYIIEQEQVINASIEEVWAFFSDVKNLYCLTPQHMNLKVLSQLDNSILYEGMLIKYYVSPLLSIPIYWETEIVHIDPQKSFTDIQTKGPFKQWIHTHYFIESDGKLKMCDKVEYELQFGIIGDAVHQLIVKRNLVQMFQYRKIFN